MSLLQFLKLGNAMGKVRETSAYRLDMKNLVPDFRSSGGPAVAQTPAKISAVRSETGGANPFTGAGQQPELVLDQVAKVTPAEAAPVRALPKAPAGSTIPAKRYVRPTTPPDELGQKAWGLLGNRLFGGSAVRR